MTESEQNQAEIPNWLLHLNREFAFPVEKVFSAWTEPEKLKGWFCNTGVAEFNPVVGGDFYVELMSEQFGLLKLTGKYLEIINNEKIKFTWKWLTETLTEVGETVVTVEFLERGNSTELKLTHEGFPTEEFKNNHTEGWSWAMENFEKSLHG
ncbi:MAG: SRPBCC domain-containing protein [Candidatus Dadabacteria bacterium]|nr:SRPBCC domain-containing protein [Candidatus Dadabacteria bacterium]NIS08791.1 SRPBCC domain-containing protein [Candidatus Dadabacteria bacterium]NIV42734.1 hypothetical protein [Candidatus Dadabacteria bacterium]NIY22135.1 hypothetical protein [Candidatus Dadabacteria bacterium]